MHPKITDNCNNALYKQCYSEWRSVIGDSLQTVIEH